MIVTFRAAARSRAARRSPRSISRGVAGATFRGLPWYLRRPEPPSALGTRPARVLSTARESPGSGDGLLPGWRQAWACRETSHDRQATCPRSQGRYRDITSLRRRQRPRPARLRAHPAVRAGPAIRDRACGRTRRHGRRRQPPPRPGSAGHRHRPAHGRARRDHRERGPPAHPAGAWLLRQRPGVGGERLRGHLRRPAAARRPRR